MASSQPDNPQPPADGSTGGTDQSAAEVPVDGQDGGEEAQLQEALKTLKEMHIQVGAHDLSPVLCCR